MSTAVERLHRITTEVYERMGASGLLPERGIELIDGLIVEMSPKGARREEQQVRPRRDPGVLDRRSSKRCHPCLARSARRCLRRAARSEIRRDDLPGGVPGRRNRGRTRARRRVANHVSGSRTSARFAASASMTFCACGGNFSAFFRSNTRTPSALSPPSTCRVIGVT